MRALVFAAAAMGFALSLSGPVQAAPVVFCANGGIDLVAKGCISGDSRSGRRNSNPGGYGPLDTAGIIGDGWDSRYMNSGGGDTEAAVEQAILDATGRAVDITLYGKSDESPSLFGFGGLKNRNGGAVSQIDDAASGTWRIIDRTLIAYITVKAANSFALYQLGPQASSGSFSTLGLFNSGSNQPGVSHISFWLADKGGGDGPEVPEPATLGLLGAGLAGLGLARRRRRA